MHREKLQKGRPPRAHFDRKVFLQLARPLDVRSGGLQIAFDRTEFKGQLGQYFGVSGVIRLGLDPAKQVVSKLPLATEPPEYVA